MNVSTYNSIRTNRPTYASNSMGWASIAQPQRVDSLDNHGNQLELDGQTLVYDANNRLSKCFTYNERRDYYEGTEFFYDYAGRNYMRRDYYLDSDELEYSNTEYFVYNNTKMIAVIENDTITDNFVWQPASSGDADVLLWDKNSVLVTDCNKNIVGSYSSTQDLVTCEYTPFGTIESGTLPSRFGFSSEEYVSATNCYHYLYRIYSPTQKRWLTRDPIQEKGGVNLYNFVYNNPVSYNDMLGLDRLVLSLLLKCHDGKVYVINNRFEYVNENLLWADIGTSIPGIPVIRKDGLYLVNPSNGRFVALDDMIDIAKSGADWTSEIANRTGDVGIFAFFDKYINLLHDEYGLYFDDNDRARHARLRSNNATVIKPMIDDYINSIITAPLGAVPLKGVLQGLSLGDIVDLGSTIKSAVDFINDGGKRRDVGNRTTISDLGCCNGVDDIIDALDLSKNFMATKKVGNGVYTEFVIWESWL